MERVGALTFFAWGWCMGDSSVVLGSVPPPPFTFWVHTCADTVGASLVDVPSGTGGARWAGCRSIPVEVNRTSASEESLLRQLLGGSHGHYLASDRRMLREHFLKMIETWRLGGREGERAVYGGEAWHAAEVQVGRQDVEADPTTEAVELDFWWLQMLPIGGWANTYEPVAVAVRRSGGAVEAVERICDTYFCVMPPYVQARPDEDEGGKQGGENDVRQEGMNSSRGGGGEGGGGEGLGRLSGSTLRNALIVLVHEWMSCVTAAGQTPVGNMDKDNPAELARTLNVLMGACAERFRASAYPLLGKGILTRVVDFDAHGKPVGYSSLTVVEAHGNDVAGGGSRQVTKPVPLYAGECSTDVVARVCSTIMSCDERARDTLLHFFSGKLGEEPRAAADHADPSSLFEWTRLRDPLTVDNLPGGSPASIITANATEDQAGALVDSACLGAVDEGNPLCAQDEASRLRLEWHVRRKLRPLDTIRLPFHSGIRGHRNIPLTFTVTQADSADHIAKMLCLPADMGCTSDAKRDLARLLQRYIDLRSYTIRLRIPGASATFLDAFFPRNSGIGTVSTDGLVDWPIFFNDDAASVADELLRAARISEENKNTGATRRELADVLENSVGRLRDRYEQVAQLAGSTWNPATNYSIVSPAHGFQTQAFLASLQELGSLAHPLDVDYCPVSNTVLHRGRYTYGPVYPRSFLHEACRQQESHRDPRSDVVHSTADPPPPRPIDFAWVGLSDELWESTPARISGLAGFSSWVGQIGGSGMREHAEPDAKVLGIYARANFTLVSSTPELTTGESNARRTGRSKNSWHFTFLEAVLMGSIPVLFEDEAAALTDFLQGYEFITATAVGDKNEHGVKCGSADFSRGSCGLTAPGATGPVQSTFDEDSPDYSVSLRGLEYSWELAQRNLRRALDRHFLMLDAEERDAVLAGTCHHGLVGHMA